MSQPRFMAERDVSMGGKPDDEVLLFAAANGYIVVSHDVNTMPYAAQSIQDAGGTMTGLLMVKQTRPIGAVIDSLVLIWSASEAEEWIGQILFLPI